MVAWLGVLSLYSYVMYSLSRLLAKERPTTTILLWVCMHRFASLHFTPSSLPSLNHYSHTQWGQEEQLLFGKVGLYLHLLRFQAGSQWMVFSWAYPLTVPWAGEVQCPAMHQQQEHTTNISCPHSNELCSSSGFGTSVNYFATFVGSFSTAMDGLTRAVL